MREIRDAIRSRTPQVSWKCTRSYSVPDLTHDVKVPLNVVPRGQYRKQDLASLEEMAKVRPGIRAAGIAGAVGVERAPIVFIPGVLNDDAALRGKQISVARVARRQHAIHHVHPPG